MILLTGEEQIAVFAKLTAKYADDIERPTRAMQDEALLEAQLKKVVEEMEKPCFEHGDYAVQHRRQCPACWQALKKEINE